MQVFSSNKYKTLSLDPAKRLSRRDLCKLAVRATGCIFNLYISICNCVSFPHVQSFEQGLIGMTSFVSLLIIGYSILL